MKPEMFFDENPCGIFSEVADGFVIAIQAAGKGQCGGIVADRDKFCIVGGDSGGHSDRVPRADGVRYLGEGHVEIKILSGSGRQTGGP